MKFERLAQPQIVDHDIHDRQEAKSQKPEHLEETHPAEIVGAEKIQSAESRVEELIADGQRRLDSLEQGIGLPVDDIVAMREETGILKKLGEIKDAAGTLVVQFRQKISEFLTRKQNKENQEIAEGATTKGYLERFGELELECDAGTKDAIRENIISAERKNRHYEMAAANLGISVEEFKAGLQNKVEEMVGRSNFFRATELDTLEQVMNSGRFKTIFETRKPETDFEQRYMITRAKFEMEMFGFNKTSLDTESGYDVVDETLLKEVLEKDKEKRSIYGYFSDEEHGAINEQGTIPPPTNVKQYGALNLKIKKERALKKATITFHDSFDGGKYWPPTPAAMPHFASFDFTSLGERNIDKLKGPSITNWGRSYTEAQYHGGLTVDDIESIHVSTKNGLSPEDIQRVRKIFEEYKRQHPQSTIQLVEF